MTVRQFEQKRPRRERHHYLLLGIGFLFTVLFVVAIVYFWDEMRDVESLAYRYGYAGALLVSILGGITIIPVPSMLAIFTLGGVLTPVYGVLNPVYVGLISGLGEALGGITVYLTGAGGGAVWSKLWSKGQNFNDQSSPGYDIVTPVQSKVRARGQA
ncbi:hypothetical protein ACFLUD_01680, partial [Chloroflexota bacterium]